MPRNRKIFIHNMPILITSRVEEGLPLVASRILNFIMWGILARARSKYDIRICHFVFMANHFHILAVVDNPEHVDDFVRHVKTESSHVINRLMGRKKRTVWCEGYDSPIILSIEDVLRYIVYIYTNPQQAKLVRRIEDYPNISSWSMYVNETYRCNHTWVRRPHLKEIDLSTITEKDEQRVLREFKKRCRIRHEFILEPNAWMDCFGISDQSRSFHSQIVTRIRETERQLLLKVKTVIGIPKLRLQAMDRPHTPEKFSRRMICLCSDKSLRKNFIQFFRSLCEKAKKVYCEWKFGIYKPCPPGLLAPGGYCHANLSPWIIR